jgi:hypothetical protein
MTTVFYNTKPELGCYDKWKEYKVPALSNKTDKGKWLNAYVNRFFRGCCHPHPSTYNYVGKIHLKLKTTTFTMNNNLAGLVGFFKNLKKLKQHQFVGEVFKAQTIN